MMGKSEAYTRGANKRWAKRRINAGNPKPGDYEILGLKAPDKGERIKDEVKKAPSEFTEKPNRDLKPANFDSEETKRDNQFQSRSIDSFKEMANQYVNPVELNNGHQESQSQSGESGSLNTADEYSASEKLQIKGFMIIIFLDMIAPEGLEFIAKRFFKQKVKSSDLKMSDEQRKEIEPIADEYAESIGMAFDNPGIALMVSSAIIYGMNFMNADKEKIEE